MTPVLPKLMLALALSCVSLADAATKPVEPAPHSKSSMEFLHFWISKGEVKAMNVFGDAFTQRGGDWHHIPTQNYPLMKIENSIRESKGYPVGALLLLGGNDIRNMTHLHRIQPLRRIVGDDNTWQKPLRSFVLDALRVDGQVMGAPIAIHNENWAWYNTRIYRELHLTLPTDWDTFLAQAPTIKQAGYLPIAVSDDYFSLRIFFSVLLAGVGGEDVYRRFFAEHDVTVLNDAKFKKTLSVFAAIRQYRSPKQHLHIWSDATEAVLDGSAAMQIMGDWAKAEFQIAHKVLDQDFACRPAPSAGRYFLAAIDVIAFPKTETREEQAGQRLFAQTVLDKTAQMDFNILKGSTPAIKDPIASRLDACTQSRLPQLKHKENILYTPRFLMSESKLSQLRSLIAAFWKNPEITPEQFRHQLKAVF